MGASIVFLTLVSKERILFDKFTLLATVVLSKKDWLKFFKYVGYNGDYYFSGAKSLGLTK